MSSYEYEEPVDVDGDARFERDMRAEQEEHEAQLRRERLAEHVTPDPKPERRMKRGDGTRPDTSWKIAVLERDQGCCVHANPAECEPPFVGHHVVTQQVMRRNGMGALLWDPRCGMGVCTGAHRRHHNRARAIRLEEIPAVVKEFIEGLTFGFYLQRHYPSSRRETEAA